MIGLSPGSKHFTKRWPWANWLELAQRISSSGKKVLWVIGPDERHLLDEIESHNVGVGAGHSVTDGWTLPTTIAAIANCSAVVSNDSAMMHMAAGTDRPGIALFGPTVADFGFAPFRSKLHVIERKLWCRPCSAHGTTRCPLGHHRCLKSITVDHVWQNLLTCADLHCERRKPHPIWRLFWRLGSPIAYAIAKMIAPFSPKLDEAITGRMTETWEGIPKHAVVFHCASVGEYEAARPVMEAMMAQGKQVVLTIGSPSLYRRRSNAASAGYPWFWAPVDLHSSVKQFLNAAEPSAVIITKHDIWPEFVWQCRERGIPTLLQSGNFRPDSMRTLAIVRSFQRSLLGSLNGIGAISSDDADRFKQLAGDRTLIRVTGDTRYDRVLTAAHRPDPRDPLLKKWQSEKPVVVLGSSWKPDEELLLPALAAIRSEGVEFRIIVVPHESDEEHIASTESRLIEYGFTPVRFSQGLTELANRDSLLVDVQGVLAQIYRGAAIAWVGGGFARWCA